MTVLLRKKVNIRGDDREIKVFLPSGTLTSKVQQQAENLDAFMADAVPAMAQRMQQQPDNIKPLEKWYLFGAELRKLVDDNDLVSPIDIKSGLVWRAVREHLPEEFDLKGSGQASGRSDFKMKNRDHLGVCYAIAKYQWKEVEWIKRWVDWASIYYIESMWKDERILPSLKKNIKAMKKYPNQDEFRLIIKHLSAQTTGRHIDILDDSAIAQKVHDAVERASKSA